jgi:hypothetical protein
VRSKSVPGIEVMDQFSYFRDQFQEKAEVYTVNNLSLHSKIPTSHGYQPQAQISAERGTQYTQREGKSLHILMLNLLYRAEWSLQVAQHVHMEKTTTSVP